MSDQLLIPQTTNPARDLYKYLFGIAQYTSPADLIQDDRGPNSASVFSFKDGIDIRVHHDWGHPPSDKPPLSIGHIFTIWPNGHFNVGIGVRKERWWNAERDLLAKYTFLQWTYVAHDKIVFVQSHKRTGNSAASYKDRLDATDWQRARPYLPCDSTNMFHHDVNYRLVRVGDSTDWKIRAVAAAPGHGEGMRARDINRRIHVANKALDDRYEFAERRYARHERKSEIESWRARGFTREPRERTKVERDEIIRTFIDHSIVFEPKSAPEGQKLLPFNARKEAMADGR